MAMVEPAFLAVTSTPSMAPSSAEVTLPASAEALWACEGLALIARAKVRQTLASSAVRIRIINPPSEILGLTERDLRTISGTSATANHRIPMAGRISQGTQ